MCPPSQAGPRNPLPAPVRERKGPVDLRHQRDLYSGFGDALARAFEFVATPALFAFLGWLLDRWLGTVAVFAVTFGLFVFGYEFWKMWVVYEARMKVEEQIHSQDSVDLGIAFFGSEVGQCGDTKFCGRHFEIADGKVVHLAKVILPRDAIAKTPGDMCGL